MSTEQEQLEGVRMDPRISKSGKAYYWFWDELPGHIKIDLRQEDGFKLEEQGPDAKYSYSVKRNDKGGFTVFRNFIGKRASPEVRAQRVEDRASLGGVSSNTKWDEIHARQEERDKAFQERHDESMFAINALTEQIGILNKNIPDLCRQIQNLLGQPKE